MSSGYSTDGYEGFYSEKQRREESRKLVTALWPEQMNYSLVDVQKACEFCSVVLTINKTGRLWCTSCGNEVEGPPVVKKTARKLKQKSQISSKAPLVILSQPRKKAKSKKLADEEELRRDLGILGDVDSQEY